MKNILKITPSWTDLKGLGNSKAIRSSYLWLFIVPILSKLFSSLNDVIEITMFGATWSLNMSLPFNLSMFYFSAVAFAIASLIYQISCPEGLKKYESFEEYKEKGKSPDSLITSMWWVCNRRKYHWPLKTKPSLLRRFIHDFTNYDGDVRKLDFSKPIPIKIRNIGIKEERIKAAYFLVADTWNVSSPVIRFVCTTFYLIGIIFFGFVLVDNFIYIIKFM